MNRLLARSRQEAEVVAQERLLRGGQPGARQRLLSMAGNRDPSGATAAAVVRAFGRLGDGASAAAAARVALLANPSAGPGLQLLLAGALVGAGRQAEADALLVPLADAPGLNQEERYQLASLQAVGAVARADRLSAAGDREAAYEELQPALESQPDNPGVNAALARLHLGAGNLAEARQITEELLRRDERNNDLRAMLIDIAIAQGDRRLAEQLLAEGREFRPGDARMALAEARLARSRGDAPRARQVLETATRNRVEELRADVARGQPAPATGLLRPVGSVPGRSGQPPADPLTAELARELAQARDETAAWLQAGGGLRSHSGQGGLSRLTEITAPVEASMPMPGLGGRIQLQAGAVSLFSGQLGGDTTSLRRFGTNPLAASPTARPDDMATGVALGLAYAMRNIRIDAGTTPLGFQQTTALGGVEVALPVTTGLQLRLAGERRAVTESMLSYAGLTDPASGRSWGGVTRNGVRGQLEYALTDRAGLYAGGGWSALLGENVATNRSVELGGGMYVAPVRTPEEELLLGLDLRYTHYDRNLRHFTFGHGGYFSPQSHVVGSLQADWRRQWGDLTTRLQGSLGWQSFREHDSAVFPNDRALQAALVGAAASDPTLITSYAGESATGPAGGMRANVEYALTPTLRIGAAGRLEHSGNYDEAAGLVYLRWRLDHPPQDLAPLLGSAPTRYPAPSWPIPSTLANGAPEPVQLNPGSTRPVW
jgi:tetratricopeptide (TPR) repeat protein